MTGAVYILENAKAGRVKVGTTINRVSDRLGAANDVWLGLNVTCQACGARRKSSGALPKHPSSQHGTPCPGSNQLPLERDVSFAEAHLDALIVRGADARMITSLAGRIEKYRNHTRRMGLWKLKVAYYTERADQVEQLVHRVLGEHLDRRAPTGEVFRCSVSEAEEAVEATLRRLGLLESSVKETSLRPKGVPIHPQPGERDNGRARTIRPAIEEFSDEEIEDANALLRFLRLDR